ncbi:IclR family transcriptional regulator [Arthrobacter sp. OV608]|uniref:IclR family transcriptional regulator n=1 Tax=Arthrobacter sp. OV608 TaxID=1882768 RepID=UPI0008D61673|nr:IclR family transcriptional regulator [Arthrobacter sp. OV608]SEQ69904.1 transcriptional regulator, IclR family [Arthrobacter sp. OV608]
MASDGVRSVLTAMRVLERLTEPGLVGVSQLARDLELPKSSVQRMLRTLQEGGWAVEVHGQVTRWTLTPKMFQLGQRHQAGNDLRTIALPVMEQLREETRETIHLATVKGDSVFVLETLDSPQAVRAHVSPGMSIPLLASAHGQALLSTRSDSEVQRVLLRGLTAYTPFTITDVETFATAIHQTRVRGYAVNNQQWQEGVHGIAAPILVAGVGVAGIGISTPVHRMSAELQDKFGEMLVKAAMAIAHGLGESL